MQNAVTTGTSTMRKTFMRAKDPSPSTYASSDSGGAPRRAETIPPVPALVMPLKADDTSTVQVCDGGGGVSGDVGFAVCVQVEATAVSHLVLRAREHVKRPQVHSRGAAREI